MKRYYYAMLGLLIVGMGYILAPFMDVKAQPDAKADTQATAPPEIIAPTVADIPKGAQATVSPEALIIDENKKVWLNKHVPVGGDTGIIVYHLKDGTYEVEVKDDKAKWLKVPLTEESKKVLSPVKVLHITKPATPPKK